MTAFQRKQFAGFWLRFVALIIDFIVVSFIVFPFAIIIGLLAPKAFLVEVPFNLFTTTTTVSVDKARRESVERDDVLGLWTNFYKVTKEKNANGDITRYRQLIDPDTRLSIRKTTSSDIRFYVIFIYWILLEASVWQASLGKKIMRLQVVTDDGNRPTIYQCAARNLLKILSGIILFIGFMMAGWTDKKQALHDRIAGMLVVKNAQSQAAPAE